MDESTNNNNMSSCANCGKGEEESISLKKCGACKMVKYCSAACQKVHRPQHKKECRKRSAELHEEALFKQQPPQEDCPICFMRMPTLHSGHRYNACCGKVICSGCLYAVARMDNEEKCSFCRTPSPASIEEMRKRANKRVEAGDAIAIYNLACDYDEGEYGMSQNRAKALELWHRSGELGCAKAYCTIGVAYDNGRGVGKDEKKAKYYYELAAMGGDISARHNLGCAEGSAGDYDRALKHFIIAVGGGYHNSLKVIQQMCSKGYVTKDDYAQALKAYQAYLDEIKSDDRDKATTFDDEYKYYEL